MSLHRKTFSQLSSPSSKASRTFQFGRNVKMSVKLDHSEDEEGNSGSGVPMAETDRFGFILGNGETDSDGPCPELVRHREAKWLNLILQWDQVIEKKSSKVKGQCQKGIPASLRAKCWPLLCGAMDRKKNNTDLYNSLDQAPGQQGWIDIIKRDTDRQFPFHEMFQSKDGHGQKDLLRVLKAYTLFRPEEGYCQAQGPVAAVLLMNMPAEEAFWCLVQISELYLPGYYSPLLEGVLFDAAILSSVLKKLCPAAHKHLKKQGVEPLMFATDWLMCLYSRHLPFNTLLRVWDLFFCYGVRVLFQVAVVLVRRCLGEGRLRKECDGQMETLERLRGVKECVQNEQTEAFIHEVCSVPLSVTDLQKQTEKEIEKWKKERPDSTFDPRRRCYGYRMAWEREQQKQKESEKKQRHRGNLSLPLMRSHSSLSPSVLRKKWRKRGSRTDAEEWDGGGRNFSQLTEESDEEEMRRRSVCGVIGEQRAKQERLSDEFYTHKQKDHNISPQCPEVVVSPCCEMPDVFEEPSQDTCSTPHTQSEKDSDSLREVDKVHIPMDNHKEETGTSLDQQDDDSSAERGQSDEKEKITENVVEETAQTHEQDIKEQTHEDQQNVENKEHQNEENTDKETCEDEQIIEKQECHSEQNVEIKMTSAHFEESTPHVETSQLNYNLQEEEIQTVSSKQEEEIQLESNNKVGETQRAACTQETTETEDFQKVKTCQDNQQSDETNIQNQENISEVEQTHVIQEDQRTHTSEDQNEENLHSERQEEEEMPIHTAPEEEEEAQPINEKNTEVDEEEFQQEVINDRDILEDTETAKEKTDPSETCEGTVENPSNDDMEKEEDGEDMTLEERDGDDHTPVEEMQVSEAALTSSSETEKETTIQHPTESIPPLSTTDPVQHCSQQTEQEKNEEITLSPGPEAQSDHPKHNDMDDTVKSNESEHSQVESKEVEVMLGSDNPEQSEVGVSDAVEPLEHECDATPPYRSTEDSNLDSSAVAASGNNSEVDETDGPENKDRCELNATEESQNGEGDICKSGSLVHVETESSNPESSEVHVATESGNIESSEVHVSTGSGDPECKAVDPAGGSGNPLHDSACAIPDNSQELESPSSVTASKSPNPNVPPAHLCLRRTSSSRSSYPTILSEDTFRVPKQMPPDHTHTEKQTRTPLAEQTSPLMCHAEMNTTEQSKPDSTQDTHTQPNSASPTKTPKLLGLFRRLRGETNKTPVPKILIQDFSEKEEKLTAKERRRRKRERERKEKEEKERKKREKEMEKDKPKERKKPQTRGKSFQILNRKCAGNDVTPGNNDSQTIRPRRNSAPFAENYF